jgi:hypothetical protein
MKQGIVYVVVAVVIVVGVLMAATPLRHRVRDLAADLKIINADTGDVVASATYQRFATRREAYRRRKTALLEWRVSNRYSWQTPAANHNVTSGGGEVRSQQDWGFNLAAA